MSSYLTKAESLKTESHFVPNSAKGQQNNMLLAIAAERQTHFEI